jgi:hypothetical protein
VVGKSRSADAGAKEAALRRFVSIALFLGLSIGGAGSQVALGGAPDFDCVDFDTQEQAQDFYDEHSDDFPDDPDPFNLDPNNNEDACDGLPSENDPNTCPRATLCVYSEDDLIGDRVDIRGRGASNDLFQQMNDEARSAWNNRSGRSRLYENVNQSGDTLCLDAREIVDDFALILFDDEASSERLQKKPTC